MTILQKKFYFEEGVCDQLAAFSKTTRLSQSWIVENLLTEFFKTNPKDSILYSEIPMLSIMISLLT